ncbi:MFS transporter [Novosphingobium umbonatum]|uniref:MFS transporter n=1 Tax=Novosphingobium umbonatum TaxID=1908524 RepID=A0A3S3TLY7_9SPHN|nr:MFS transporter [Novosphingobium umbonatum]RVU04089.1 MFS transporter [Novosphingobium umbonatum]
MSSPPLPSETSGYRLICLIIASALFMETLDATVLATALPTLARDFGVRPPAVSVAVTAYLLALAVFIPVSGYMADRYGARKVFASAIGLFVAGSLACALAPALDWMALARFAQGIGGAMMLPVGRLVMLRVVPKKDLVNAASWMMMPGLLGTILGPPLGGFIVALAHWRMIFWINVPTGIIALWFVLRHIPDVRSDDVPRFDWLGFMLAGGALAGLMVGAELAGPVHALRAAVTPLAAGMALGMIYFIHARNHPAPLLDFTLLRVQTFRLSWIAGSLTRLIQGAQPFLLSLMLQYGFGYSAAKTGTITLATALGSVAMKGLAGRVLRRLGYRRGLIVMGLLGTLTYGACGFFTPAWPHWAILLVLVAAGFFLSFSFTAYNTIAYEGIAHDDMSKATSFYTTFQQVTLSLGVCFAATSLQLSMLWRGVERPDLPDFALAFWIVAGVSFLAIFPNWRFAHDAGAEMTGEGTGVGGD